MLRGIVKAVGMGLAALLLVLVGLVAWLMLKSATPAIDGPDPIASLRTVSINGDQQAMLIRGEDRSKPILFFLHGGPGMAMMYLGHRFQRPLERDFVVVQWDRRAAGKSWGDEDPAKMRMSQYVDDSVVAIRYVLDELHQEKVILVGHSHGTYLGALVARAHPELLSALVGIGQVADEDRARRIQDEELARRYPNRDITGANREELLFDSGSELHASRSMWPLIRDGLLAPEYSLADVLNVAKGPQFAEKHMQYDVIDGPLMTEVTDFAVPVHIIMGEYDLVTPTALAREYFQTIRAPYKTFNIFPRSAHFPHYEEPERFAALMRGINARLEQGADFNKGQSTVAVESRLP